MGLSLFKMQKVDLTEASKVPLESRMAVSTSINRPLRAVSWDSAVSSPLLPALMYSIFTFTDRAVCPSMLATTAEAKSASVNNAPP